MSKSQRVGDYMIRRVITVSQDMEIMRAIFQLLDKRVSGVPVVDAAGTLVGMLTERDCMAVVLAAGYLDEPGGRVADYMSHPVETVDVSDSIMDIAVRFRDTRYRRYPVMKDGRMVGVITRRDVLRALKRGAWFSPE